jgi:hypothetical protein
MGPHGFEPQRNGQGAGDCVVASLSTVANIEYEKAAELLGVQVDPVNGHALIGNGLSELRVLYPLYCLGWNATLLVGRDHEGLGEEEWGDYVPTSDQLKEAIRGRRALICYNDPEISAHMIAWDGKVAVDCSDGAQVHLNQITVKSVVLIEPLQQVAQV